MAGNDSNRVAVRVGASYGIALGCLTGVQYTLALFGLSASALQGIGSVLMLVGFVAYLSVGLLVRRHTGSVEAAVRAGLLAGVAAGMIACAAGVALDGLAPDVYQVATAQVTQTASGLGPATLVGVLNLAVQAGLGAGLALVGALARRPKTAP